MEADKLKQIISGGTATKVVALGIGNKVEQTELYNMASAPSSNNVIRVKDFSSLDHVEGQLVSTACNGNDSDFNTLATLGYYSIC